VTDAGVESGGAAAPTPSQPGSRAGGRSPSLPQLVLELRDLVIAYFKQETITPLKALGRYAGFGLAGALLLGFGALFLSVGALRALQTETGGTFDGDWSWAPYLIVVTGLVIVLGIVFAVSMRGSPDDRAKSSQEKR
jgi:putative superfamily III holin-X